MTQLETKVTDFIAESLGIDGEEVTPKSSLRKDLGAETVTIGDLLSQIQEEFKIDLEEVNPEEIKTVGQIINLVVTEAE